MQFPPREEWDFSAFAGWPEENLRHAWAWEMDRELGSGKPPFITRWELRQLQKHNELLQTRLNGKVQLGEQELQEKLAEYILPDPKHALEGKIEELDAEISKIKRTLKYYKVENESNLNARLEELRHERSAAHEENLRRLSSNLAKLRSHIRASKGKRGKLLSDEEYEAICPSPKAAPPKGPKPPMLKSYPLGEILGEMLKRNTSVEEAKRWNFLYGSLSTYSTIHAVEVDWTLSETQLVEAFRNWLRDGPTPYSTGHQSTRKAGRKDSHRAWLQELAIYRLSKGGVTRKEGLKLLNIQTISAPNWAHAQARTRKRIKGRERDLRSLARNAHHWSGSQNWRDYFAEL